VVNNLERRYLETESEWKREEISQYQSESDCEKCKGMRLKDEALCVKIDNVNISEVTKKSISDAKEWFSSLNEKLDEKEKKMLAQNVRLHKHTLHIFPRLRPVLHLLTL